MKRVLIVFAVLLIAVSCPLAALAANDSNIMFVYDSIVEIYNADGSTLLFRWEKARTALAPLIR